MTRKVSRRVNLTASFLLLAAGGTAACDDGGQTVETFYCADGNGVVVDDDHCERNGGSDGHGGYFYVFHSPGYHSGYAPGTRLPAGGSSFRYSDQASRTKFGLPSTGKIGNGTVKTSVVGKGGGGTGKGGGGKAGG